MQKGVSLYLTKALLQSNLYLLDNQKGYKMNLKVGRKSHKAPLPLG